MIMNRIVDSRFLHYYDDRRMRQSTPMMILVSGSGNPLIHEAALARLGEMAAVVAHEVKNPLAGIRGAMQVFGGRMSPDDASARVLKDIVARIDAMRGKGRIRVAIDTVGTSCQIAFIDRGPGIPPEIREKIFTPFFTTKSRGSGLGLPIAKHLIEAHNGQIAIDCPPDGGTTVVVGLPLAASQDAAAELFAVRR
jgi:signal transduction histidine kinase